MTRIDGRAPDELRPIIITPDYLSHPLASVLISCGYFFSEAFLNGELFSFL